MDDDRRWKAERGRWLGRDRGMEGRERGDWIREDRDVYRDRNTDPNQYSRYGRDEEWEGRFGPEDYGGGTSRGGVDYERQGFQIRGGGRGDYERDYWERDYGERRDLGRGFGQGRGFRDYARDEWSATDADRMREDRARQVRREFGHDYARDRARRMREGSERGWLERMGDEVASWFGDEDAERRRQRDEERSHRGRGPRGYTRSDDRIREDVSDRLTDDLYVDASDIEVAVSGGEVTLAGHVEHRGARRRAEDLAESVSGVTHVQNNLRVRSASEGTGAGASAMAGMTKTRR
ncbi:BON domain-containing protein [Azospirillum sp.]|uniref:BON domain-containing protein n=1 Tax=Azospirillum sp. TaxID=34012 RepID=UPI003D74B28C